jgi:hypothetical protein
LRATNEPSRPSAARRPLERALQAIVVDALRVGVGEALPTNSHYLQTAGASAGTVQRALKLLADQGALVTTSRGHLGRVVESLQVGSAWHIAGLPPLRLLLPPIGPVEIDVLAEAIAGELTELGVPHTIRHQRGGSRRLDALHAGDHDLVIVSAGAFQGATERFDRSPTLLLAPGTYYAPHRLVAVTRTGEAATRSGLRVAMDQDSPDHILLTESAFPPERGHSYVDCRFPEVPTAVLRGQVDVGLWHLSRTVIPLDLAGLSCTEMEDLDTTTEWRELSGAVLVGSERRGELGSVLAAIRLSALFTAQQQRLREEPQ